MSTGSPRGRVTLEPRRLWTLRMSLGATRWVFYAVALCGILATARNAIAPPRQQLVVEVGPRTPDPGAQWFALRFARAYLTWSGDLSGHEQGLAPFLGSADDRDAGLTPVAGSTEQVRWLAIAGERDRAGGEQDYTVAADTGTGPVRYVEVAVSRRPDGSEMLAHYPAFVDGPTPAPASGLDGGALPTVTDRAVVAVLDRALRNYVGSSDQNLAADLAPGAVVAPIAPGLSLRAIQRLVVEPSGAVLATVIAADRGGDAFTLAYEVSVTELAGRWEIARIEP
ncbi:MAG TPA: conjugal transfer protein [Solirubrobacteraceae bacterium]|nr:conjugal transfer protein [Solirubrobacteraceae bacterium]